MKMEGCVIQIVKTVRLQIFINDIPINANYFTVPQELRLTVQLNKVLVRKSINKS